MKTFLIFPNNLFKELPNELLQADQIVLIEEPLFFKDPERITNFNKLKLLLHRASMKYYFDYLKSKDLNVEYFDFQDYNLSKILKGCETLVTYDLVDHLLSQRLSDYCKKNDIKWEVIISPLFLFNHLDLEEYKSVSKDYKRRYFHDTFYRWGRKRLKILLDKSGEFIGKQASYDTENRKSLPNTVKVPDLPKKPKKIMDIEKKYIEEAQEYVEKNFADNYGNTNNICHLVFSFEGAEWQLEKFLEERLYHFGDYQDAISDKHKFLFHSILSAPMNIGLISPKIVIDKTVEYYESHKDVGLNNVEGFIRQVMGWREYIRLVYAYEYEFLIKSNAFEHHRKLKKSWYNGTTGWKILDDTIKQAFDWGYLHHIQRLMVMGNIMNIMEIEPDEVYKWFMEFAIDSYDWVMIANVYSMILYSDGGLVTTKPYTSSDAYIKRMSNYKGDGIWDKKWNTMYYYYMSNTYINFKGKKELYYKINPRTGYMLRNWERKSASEKEEITKEGKKILEELTIL